MKIKRKLYSDIPMTFEVKEIGEDNEGKFAIISAKNDITGEIIEKKMYENKSYDSEKDFSDSAEEIGAGLAAGGLGAGVGYLGYRGAKGADKSLEDIADKIRNKKSGKTNTPGITTIETRGEKYQKVANKVEKAGKKIENFAKTKGGKAALIATPAVIAGGTTYISKRRKRKKESEEK